MVQVFDININKDKLQEVERLKNDFKNYLEPTVKNGTVIILGDFPPIGNLTGSIDYIFFIYVQKNGGYLRTSVNNSYCNIDSLIFLVKKIEDKDIINIDNNNFYSLNSEFNYQDSIKNNNSEFQDFCEFSKKIKSSLCYQIKNSNSFQYQNPKTIINLEITAKYIIESATTQYVEKFGSNSRINAFERDFSEILSHDLLIRFVNEVLEETSNKLNNGVLTKRKLDRISTSSKFIEEIHENIGKSLTIIRGKAGTGKTLTLMRLIFKLASNNYKIRFLTFNNLLVFDLKQSLRNFGFYGDTSISLRTVHRFFYEQSEKLGIRLILNEGRCNEILEVCNFRLEKLRDYFYNYFKQYNPINSNIFLNSIPIDLRDETNFEEFREFVKFIFREKDLTDFDILKKKYLDRKRNIILPNIGKEAFLEDYYKFLELIYLAITDSKRFYDEQGIKNRYDLLSILYKTDSYIENVNKIKTNKNIESISEIPFENFLKQVKSLERLSNWSKLLIIDEGQDFHFYEKEILFHLRGSENLIVATGGKEQLIRHSKLLDWSVSFGKKISHLPFNLAGGSYRQKQNIVNFVNSFSKLYEIDINLKSVSESKGLGKIIIDIRSKSSFINEDIASELKNNGETNGCTPYEGVLYLIPSKNYTSKKKSESFIVNEKDYVQTTEITTDRKILNLDTLEKLEYFCWDGVSENKGKLKVPYQNETRIIHYESCRGIEAWSVACMSLDEYFNYKRKMPEAENYLSDDLFYTEEQRRDKYAAIWCIMAFTRPIDTLYINIDKPYSEFAQKLISIANQSEGCLILS